jgi:sialic acid synthase SpsE
MGELAKARRLVEIGADCGLDAVKFQLLSEKENTGGNIGMEWEWLPELIELGNQKGVEVFASVFDRSGWDWIVYSGCKSVKLSYSQADKLGTYPHIHPLENIYVSQDVMSPAPVLKPVKHNGAKPPTLNLVRLYCLPFYPVQHLVDFEGLFPRFDGFSSHCLGMMQEVAAATAGAKVLEFHFQGDWKSDCPDGLFAKSPALTEKLCKRVKA